jgi:hypothetical protein
VTMGRDGGGRLGVGSGVSVSLSLTSRRPRGGVGSGDGKRGTGQCGVWDPARRRMRQVGATCRSGSSRCRLQFPAVISSLVAVKTAAPRECISPCSSSSSSFPCPSSLPFFRHRRPHASFPSSSGPFFPLRSHADWRPHSPRTALTNFLPHTIHISIKAALLIRHEQRRERRRARGRREEQRGCEGENAHRSRCVGRVYGKGRADASRRSEVGVWGKLKRM